MKLGPVRLEAGAPSGVKPASRMVIVLPSFSRMPVTGRQNSWKYFDSQIAIPASAIAVLTSASSRARSAASVCRSVAIFSAIWLYSRGGAHRLGVPSYAQKMPICVCAAVRIVGVTTPSPPSMCASA